MRNLIVIAALMTLIGSAALAVETGTEKSPGAMQQKQTLYACPMHPEVRASWPADCPKCGMKLVAQQGPAAIESPAERMSAGKPAAEKPTQPEADVLYQCPMHPEVILAQPGKCPKCGMALVAKSRGLLIQEAHQAGGVAKPGQPAARSAEGTGGAMAAMHGQMLRRRTMLTVRIDNADPAAMLALGDALKLTKEQSAKLTTIAADARKKALALLNAEQRKTLSAVPNEPASLTDVHRAAPSLGEQKDK